MRRCSFPQPRLVWPLILLVIVGLAGCPSGKQPPKSASAEGAGAHSESLTLLVVEDEKLGQAIAREWQARTEERLSVQPVTREQLASAHRLPGDAIVFPSALLGHLAERGLILPLDAGALDEPSFDQRDIFDFVRRVEMRWGNRVFAAPLGSPQLLLAYRVDVFEKLAMSPPATWDDYQKTLARLHDARLADSPGLPPSATSEPLAEGWAGLLFLARAAAYALHRDQVSALFQYDTLVPLIDQPPYVRALEELKQAAAAGGLAGKRQSPAECFADLLEGRAAMALCWPDGPSAGGSASAKAGGERQHAAAIRFAPLPGSSSAYRFATKGWEPRGKDEPVHVPLAPVAGRLAAVTSASSATPRAQTLVLWLAGREIGGVLAAGAQTTAPFRHSQAPDASRWAASLGSAGARQYAEVLGQALESPRVFQAPRLPGQDRYLAALDQAVARVLDGQQAPQAALAQAREEWEAITESLGRAAQKRASARALGEERL